MNFLPRQCNTCLCFVLEFEWFFTPSEVPDSGINNVNSSEDNSRTITQHSFDLLTSSYDQATITTHNIHLYSEYNQTTITQHKIGNIGRDVLEIVNSFGDPDIGIEILNEFSNVLNFNDVAYHCLWQHTPYIPENTVSTVANTFGNFKLFYLGIFVKFIRIVFNKVCINRKPVKVYVPKKHQNRRYEVLRIS